MSSHQRVRGRYRDTEKTTSSSDSDSDIPLPSLSTKRRTGKYWTDRHATGLGNLLALSFVLWLFAKGTGFEFPFPKPSTPPSVTPKFIEEGIRQCEIINRSIPHFEPSSNKRKENDRYVKGTKPTLLKNGTLWTGEKDGHEVLYGVDILIENGLIRKIGKSKDILLSLKERKDAVEEVELNGSWVTPGIVDLHSHMGVDAAPETFGSEDTNSVKQSVMPFLRSLDGFNTHDLAFNLSISGGITTMLVLPGSADSIGGQAFPFKPRWTAENTPQSMLVEPAWKIDNGTWARTHSWRHIKHACGENPKRVYSQTRMDNAYDFRQAYTHGKELKDKQDRWCTSPKTQTEPFPTSLDWEVLSDVIRGNVKVNIHCYETTDLNSLVRISNEFQFPIAAFHHAHETYLVPELLKQAWGPPPAVAIFSTNARYKREAYRGTQFAPKILSEEGLSVIMKSDHPVLDSRYLIAEASWANHFGLNTTIALNSVTTSPAKAMGLDHRIGYLREGYDADIVIWDSFPLVLGATPKQTYIDGIKQILHPISHEKPVHAQKIPPTGKWDKEAREAVEFRGDQDLRPKKSAKNVIFQDVGEFHLSTNTFAEYDVQTFEEGKGVVIVQAGEITCVGKCSTEQTESGFEIINLKGGAITPGVITVGSKLGLVEIDQEKSTWDGVAPDPLNDGSELTNGLLIHGVDGAQFDGKNELLAYRAGVTTGVAYPKSSSWINGISFSFSPGALHPLSEGAIQSSYGALHITLDNSKTSVSTKIAILRKLLTQDQPEDAKTELTEAFDMIKDGKLVLVVKTDKADTIASLIRLKKEHASKSKITILGGLESWLVAEELAENDIGVIVAPVRSYPGDWNTKRILPSVPLSNHTLPSYLVSRGITVGLGIKEEWQAPNTMYEAAWVYANSPSGIFTKSEALDLVGKNLEKLLGLNTNKGSQTKAWVAHQGDPFSFGGKIRGVKGVGQVEIDLF
ncbi:uncharacterized protein IL334_005202 [Kwoniella shivajii]|uniref:Amidohydrolase-related domain-containing protein n=1 Tax=Kwoniella shivajii TaxID=564305 RepID=A0ABZ1D5H1_9TREE|nr:hypothetical protein IL334_005202 [Kwoniella shivajii]